MLGFTVPLLSLIRLRGTGDADPCLVCSSPIRRSDERMDVPGGGRVHRGCATYRMRRHAQTVRRIASS